ncbi:hypothetical protein ACWIUD_08500 [Helicobacter sp. 23-1044]
MKRLLFMLIAWGGGFYKFADSAIRTKIAESSIFCHFERSEKTHT